MIKTKKQMFTLIGAFLLVIMLGTITYAFFNYTRTGTANTIRTGRIAFNSTQGTAINLTNMFPIDVSEGIPNDATKVGTVTINVIGDTTYTEGLEYLVSAVNVQNTVGTGQSAKTLPISIDVAVANNTNNEPATTLGTSDEGYFTDRGGDTSYYKVLAGETINTDDKLVVGYIAPGSTGVDGNIVIRAYLDSSRIAITDTYDGNETDNMGTTNDWVDDRTVFTTTEWNSLQQNGVSFQIKVESNEGIWVERPLGAYGMLKNNADTTTTIDFGLMSSSTNGEGLYRLLGTENNTYPIYYYRGLVIDNNVIFGDHCWQMVRTTDTGGIKMIYNGTAKDRRFYENNIVLSNTDISYTNDNSYPFNYDSTTQKWTSTNKTRNTISNFTFKVTEEGNYFINYSISSAPEQDFGEIYKNGTLLNSYSGLYDGSIDLGSLTSSDTIKISYAIQSWNAANDNDFSFKIVKYSGNYETRKVCENNGRDKNSLPNKSIYNPTLYSMSDAGYMSNKTYPAKIEQPISNAYFGNEVEYGDFNNNGNSVYRLVEESRKVGYDNNHHYTCNLDDANGTCVSVRYYFFKGTYYVYIDLENGETVEDALYKMTGNASSEVKARAINQNYNLNVNDSTIKGVVEDWFRTNLTNEVNSSTLNYQIYLEDTIFCSDRSFKQDGSYSFETSGWNPNGGNYDHTQSYFGTLNRVVNNNWYSTNNVPTFSCPNETDRFSVNNPKAHLNYPVGLLTTDEIVLAGYHGNDYGMNNSYYLSSEHLFWTMTPYGFYGDGYYDESIVFTGGQLYLPSNGVSSEYDIRPVISLKLGTEFETGGNGTPTNPYVVKYN